MSTDWWMAFWWWWLVAVLITFCAPEVVSILLRVVATGYAFTEWTLSDCICRWAHDRHWIAPTACGAATLLLVHWFLPR